MSDSKGAAELAELIGAFSYYNPAKAKRLKVLLAQEVNNARIDELKKIVDLPNIQIPAGVHVQARYVSAVEDRINQLERLG